MADPTIGDDADKADRQTPPDPTSGPGTGTPGPIGALITPDDPDRAEFAPHTVVTDGVPVVGIGASAGGLEALRQLFGGIPADCGMAFVVIQHLAPHQPSQMAELLATHTALQVVQSKDGTAVKPGTAYVVPPGRHLVFRKGVLQHTEPERRDGVPVPIDLLFRSLASDRQEKAIGIILTGTGSDGTLGLRAIKESGGLIIVQDPATAAFDGMPRSAVATGLVDYVLPIDQMPRALLQYINHSYVNGEAEQEKTPYIEAILSVLQVRTKQNFRCYKRATLARRIQRRMGLHHLCFMKDYLDLLRGDPLEQRQLARDFLISVTRFFRDPEAFATLEEKAIIPLVRQRDVSRPLRVWVPGCATGEEAFSIAMLLIEQCAAANQEANIQVFASDVDDFALGVGRAGIYPENIVADIAPERLRRFFIKEDSTYRVAKSLRETVTFAVQNLVSDPPFSRLNLISCRNVLIYLDPEVQPKVLGLFHFALRDGGFLFLGNAETTGRQSELFAPVSKPHHLYRRTGPRPGVALDFPLIDSGDYRPLLLPTRRVPSAVAPLGRQVEVVHEALLAEYSPAAVLVNRQYEIAYLHGPVARYLEVQPGEPRHNLLAMTPAPLQSKLRVALHQVFSTNERIEIRPVMLGQGDTARQVMVTVRPVPGTADQVLVTFQDETQPAATASAPNAEVAPEPPALPGDRALVQHLDQELRTVREELQSTLEELETTNEEYKASIEEAMSVNEELQSTNEELETSKEELQSINEEIHTVNHELKQKISELEQINNDLANLLTSTDIATIFLDIQLQVKRYTPPTQRLLSLIPGDLGRPLRDIALRCNDDRLLDDARNVIARLMPIEREILAEDGGLFMRRVLPYRTTDGRIEGAVITFTDITKIKEGEAEARRLATVVRDSQDAMLVLGLNGRVTAWNRGAERLYGFAEREALGMAFEELVPADRRSEAKAALKRVVAGETLPLIEAERLTSAGERLIVESTLSVLTGPDDKPQAISAIERDVTARKRAEQSMATARTAAEQASSAKSRFLAAASHDLRQPLQAADLYLGLLAHRNRDPELAPLIDRQRDALQAMENLLGSLLDLSRADAGLLQSMPEDFQVGPVLTEIAAEGASLSAARGLGIRVVPCGAMVRSDPVLLRRLLRNLVSNAVKYTETGRVLVGCRRGGEQVRIQVWDTGIGIPVDKQKAIFEEFYQLDNEARDRAKGFGLGLSIVDRVAKLLGHPLHLCSVPGKGSMFEVCVPLATRSVAANDPGSAPVAVDRAPVAQGPLVLIDDDPLVLMALQMQFVDWGWDVVAGPTFEAVWAGLGGRIPRIVVADFRLGAGDNGIQVIERLREAVGVRLPGVLVTGDTAPEQLRETQRSGLRLLHKPVSAEVVRKMIEEATRV